MGLLPTSNSINRNVAASSNNMASSSGTPLESGFKQLSLKTPHENTSSAACSNEFENTTTTTPTSSESLKLHSDYLRNILNFLNIKDAHSLNLASRNVNQILNKTHCQKTLPYNITLESIDMQKEAREGVPSTQRLVNDAGHWDAEFIMHCLEKTKCFKSSYTINKRRVLFYTAELGDMTLLKSLK